MPAEKTFIPFQDIRKYKDVLVVDSYYPEAFNLSHWRGAPKSELLLDDTSTGIVLNAIKRNIPQLKAPYVTNNHFDIDGFLGVWSLLNPGLALENEVILREMALIGDFRELNLSKPFGDEALKLVCWINSTEKAEFYPPFGASGEMKLCIEKYNFYLKEFSKVLSNPEDYQDAWDLEFQLVKHHYNLVNREIKNTETIPEIKLLIVKAPHPLHYYALFSNSSSYDMVMSIYPENRYELEYKYTTWIDTAFRSSFPRMDLLPLANKLTNLEKSGKTWTCDKITDTGPILRLSGRKLTKEQRFDHPYNREIKKSSLHPEEFKNIIIKYYQEMYKNIKPRNNWSWQEIKDLNQNTILDY
ncbi:hypothetical protein BH23BAC1_BH23BAC1_01090 [soil metagenome]